MNFERNRAIVEETAENILDVGVNSLATMMAKHGFVPPESESWSPKQRHRDVLTMYFFDALNDRSWPNPAAQAT